MKGLSDSTLNNLWRRAVLISWGFDPNKAGSLECHHWAVKRKHKLTRWKYTNGIPLCSLHDEGCPLCLTKQKYCEETGQRMSCHQFAHLGLGLLAIIELAGKEIHEKLVKLGSDTIKNYCAKNGITERDYIFGIKRELEEICA